MIIKKKSFMVFSQTNSYTIIAEKVLNDSEKVSNITQKSYCE